ncbi:immunoglobulin-binding protein 1 [Lates japonicus]|nr:immunoglobulin-binding protein 1 [Lates japonicus]
MGIADSGDSREQTRERFQSVHTSAVRPGCHARLEKAKTERKNCQKKEPEADCCRTASSKVFGLSYSQSPTMTVDDWYDQHRKAGAQTMIPRRSLWRMTVTKEREGSAEKVE